MTVHCVVTPHLCTFDAMTLTLRWSLLRLGVAGWLLVGIPACSQEEAPPGDGDVRAGLTAEQAEEEARKQELLAKYSQMRATEEDRLAAEQGDADAQALLAAVYHNGRGVEQDYEEAVRWARLAAEQGNASGQGMLAAAYYSGTGVSVDYDEAARWARLAAEQDEASGQIILGALYLNGNGVPQDYVSAYTWMAIAASDPDTAGGSVMLDHLATRRMTPEQLAEAEARVRDWMNR